MKEIIVPPHGLDLDERNVVRTISDRLYRVIHLTGLADKLTRTPQVARLKRVAVLGLLDGMVDLNASASKFEHSLGVYWLLTVITRLEELYPYRKLLTAAAFAHDLASPPFTHTTEPVMREILGLDHEQALALPYYRQSEFATVLAQHNVSYEEVVQLAQGHHPNRLVREALVGPLDMDTLDGTCRYSLMWRPAEQGLPYQPLHIVYYYEAREGRWVIQDQEDELEIPQHHLHGFINCRQDVFARIHGERIAGPESLIGRALYLAMMQGELDEPFFRLTDEEAVQHLRRCNGRTKWLIQQAALGERFECVMEEDYDHPQPGLAAVLNHHLGPQVMADEVAAGLGLPPEAVTIQAGRSKQVKDLTALPVLTDEGDPARLPRPRQTWYVRTFLAPYYSVNADAVAQAVERRLEG
jgi:HD superfamily phosphohydrolase